MVGPGKRDKPFGLLLVVRQVVWRPPFQLRAGLLCAGALMLSTALLPAGRGSGGAGSELESAESFVHSAKLLSVSGA